MKYSRLWVLVAIITAIILIGFVFSVPHTRDTGVPVTESATTSIPVVTLRDSFKKGVHTITGSLTAKNACSAVRAEATLLGETSSTDSILVALSVSEDSGLCLQVPTRVSFTTTVSAGARLPITVTVNGAAATTTPS